MKFTFKHSLQKTLKWSYQSKTNYLCSYRDRYKDTHYYARITWHEFRPIFNFQQQAMDIRNSKQTCSITHITQSGSILLSCLSKRPLALQQPMTDSFLLHVPDGLGQSYGTYCSCSVTSLPTKATIYTTVIV